jgi:hypothetical protein
MIVHDFDIVGIAVPPLEADSIAVIDADAVLPFPVGFERFQMEARQPEVAQRGRGIDAWPRPERGASVGAAPPSFPQT